VVARELSNVFEWEMHAPLAVKAGVPATALTALAAGEPVPDTLRSDLKLAHSVAMETVTRHRLDDATYARAVAQWGDSALVELITLIGYFAMVCWLMNVARTPAASA
jgi:4-carboxymuconolactone decarboxylase